MFIQFKVGNFRSIRDTQTFSLVASASNELDKNTFLTNGSESLRLVRSAAIYGANASGKSNLLSALQFMNYWILYSAKAQHAEKIPIKNFIFNENSTQKPSEFEITFITENVRYQYGFTLNQERIFEEWLFAYPNGRSQQWFSRVYKEGSEKNFQNEFEQYDWKFSKYFKGGKGVSSHTLKNILFFSNAVKLNNTQLLPAYNWFKKDLLFVDLAAERPISRDKTLNLIKTLPGKQKILEFVKAADSSISDLALETKKINSADTLSFPDNMPTAVQDYLISEMLGKDHYKIKFQHKDTKTLLDLYDQSDGTIRSLNLAGYWLEALECGGLLIVDELDNSLHPNFVKFLIELINNPETNRNNAQLIFSTHDTSLLDNEIFRRDQIWFVEKDKSNATQIYPLLDFSPRKQEAIGKGYLQGRYGALPFIGEWRF